MQGALIMIKPEADLELSIKALEVYGVPTYIIENMLYNLKKIINPEAVKEDEEKLNLLLKTLEISKSGYGGILQNGNIVDRREHPEAIPIEENKMFGVPKPIKIKK